MTNAIPQTHVPPFTFTLLNSLPGGMGVYAMSRNLARQISRDLHSDRFAMVLTAGFYSDSRTHNVRKVRVVKYKVVYGQIKAADQKYCHNQNK